MDPMESFRGTDGWLRGVGMSQVSRFVLLHPFVIDALDLGLYSFDLHLIASTAGFNNPIQTFGVVCGWLCGICTSKVSRFNF